MHGARIVWQNTGDFAAGDYSRAHTWHFDGGAVVAASSSPLLVALPWSDAAAVDPEEAFIAALSSCHMLWFLDLARRAGFVASGYTDTATGVMAKRDGRVCITDVTLRPRVDWSVAPDAAPDAATESQLHHAAHTACFIANSVTTHIHIDLQGETP